MDNLATARDADEQNNEAALISGLVTGSEKAWREFHKRYDSLIHRCITKVTSHFSFTSRDDVREIYANLMVQLLSNDMHKLRSFDIHRGNRFSSWIGLLAHNAAYDYLRSIRREGTRAPVTEAEALTCDMPSPLETLERRRHGARVEALLAELSEKDQQFVELYFAEGLEPTEVAERMQISVKTVYSKRHKIQSKLEAMLAAAA